MATRRLEVDLVVDDSQARAAFARTGRSVGLLEQQFGRSGAAISKAAGAASNRISQIGSAAKTAAPFVAGGLALGLGKAVAEAREAEKAMGQTEAVIRSTGGAANVTAGQVASLSERISEKAAIDDEAIQSGANLLLTFKNIRNEAGEGDKVFNRATSTITDMSVALDTDLKSAAIQVGKALNDPTIGLTALTRSGVTFTEQQKETIQSLFESGEQLKAQKMILRELSSEFQGSAAAQADAGDRITVVFDNLAEDLGSKILPGLEDLGNEISDVLSSKKLTGDEKAERLGEILQERVEDGIDAISEIAPEAARVGGEIAAHIVTGFAEAWWNSDAIGKLFLTGAFIRVIGGPGAIGKLGSAVGGRIATSMATTIAADLAAETAAANALGGKSSKWAGLGRSIGRQIGPAMGGAGAVFFLAAFQDDIQRAIGAGQSDPIFSNILNSEALDAVFGGGSKKWNTEPLMSALGTLEGGFKNFGDVATENTRAVARAFRKLDNDVEGAVDNTVDAVGRGADKIDDLGGKAPRDLDKVGDSAEKNVGRRTPDALKAAQHAVEIAGKATDKFADGSSRDFKRVGDSSKKQGGRVADNSASMVNAVLEGYGILGEETQDALKAFGVNKAAYKVGNSIAKGADGVQFKQQGGMVVPGHGSGDIFGPVPLPAGGFVLNRDANNAFFGLQTGGVVPTMLEPGERVFDRATPTLQLMNELVPRRLQKGGAVGGLDFALGPYDIPPIQYAADHAGGNSHVHITGTTTPWVVGIGKQLQSMGFMVGEHPAFGGVQGTHSATGGHYDALAIDVNSAADETRSEVAKIAGILGGSGIGGAVAEKLARIILKGPKGPLLSMGQGGLDMTRKAANAYIAKHTPSMVEGGGISADGDVERVFAQVARKLSQSKTATLALGMAGYAESGMRDLSYGDSTSQGALQLLSSTAAGLGISPHDEGAIASTFFNQGFFGKGGANSLAASGLPAHLVAQGVQGSAFSDGSNYLAQKGAAQGWMNRYGLQSGGKVARTTPLDSKISDLADLINSLENPPLDLGSGNLTFKGPKGPYGPTFTPTGGSPPHLVIDTSGILEAAQAQLEEMKAAREALDEIRQEQADQRRRAETGSGITREQILDAIGTTVDERIGVRGAQGRRMAGVGTLGTGSF